MAQLPECMRAAEQATRDEQAGQNDMFSTGSASAAPALVFPEEPDWPVERRLAGERDTLGHYLSGHPTDAWREVLAQLTNCPIGEISQRFTPPKARNNDSSEPNRYRRSPETAWVVAGQMVDVRKRGDSMAFVQMEDGSGRIEVNFYREAFVEFGSLLTRDAMLVIEGGLAWDEFAGGLRLRARRVLTLNEACERYARLLRLRLNGADAEFIASLQHVLNGYRGGQTAVRLNYANGSGRAELELGADWRVRATTELMRALSALPGVLATEMLLLRPVPEAN